MIGSRGIPARAGGVERVVEELTRELTARGHEVLVYGRRHYLAGSPPPDCGRVIVTPGLGAASLDTITHTATAMADVLFRGADVVHVHSPGPAAWTWLASAAGLPVVLTVHAADWRREKWSPLARGVILAGLHLGMRLAAEVTAVSPGLAEELSGRFGRVVHCIPNAVRPPQPQAPRLIERWGLSPDGYLLYVGRIVPEKRLSDLLEAHAQAQTPVPLVVVGDADESAYSRACRRGAGRNVCFVGPQYGQALAELYANAAALVHPSVLEGMSLVLLEAAACSRCIIAADIPANRETLGDGALYYRGGGVDELSRLICRILKEEGLREKLGRTARERSRTGPTWSEVAARMESVYRRAMRGRREE